MGDGTLRYRFGASRNYLCATEVGGLLSSSTFVPSKDNYRFRVGFTSNAAMSSGGLPVDRCTRGSNRLFFEFGRRGRAATAVHFEINGSNGAVRGRLILARDGPRIVSYVFLRGVNVVGSESSCDIPNNRASVSTFCSGLNRPFCVSDLFFNYSFPVAGGKVFRNENRIVCCLNGTIRNRGLIYPAIIVNNTRNRLVTSLHGTFFGCVRDVSLGAPCCLVCGA